MFVIACHDLDVAEPDVPQRFDSELAAIQVLSEEVQEGYEFGPTTQAERRARLRAMDRAMRRLEAAWQPLALELGEALQQEVDAADVNLEAREAIYGVGIRLSIAWGRATHASFDQWSRYIERDPKLASEVLYHQMLDDRFLSRARASLERALVWACTPSLSQIEELDRTFHEYQQMSPVMSCQIEPFLAHRCALDARFCAAYDQLHDRCQGVPSVGPCTPGQPLSSAEDLASLRDPSKVALAFWIDSAVTPPASGIRRTHEIIIY